MSKLMNFLINNCKETSMQIANNEEMTPANQLRQKLHLIVCTPCRRFYQQMKSLNENVRKIKLNNLNLDKINQEIIDKYKK